MLGFPGSANFTMSSLVPQHFLKFISFYAAVFQDGKKYAIRQFLAHMYRDGRESHLSLVNATQLRMRAALPLNSYPNLGKKLNKLQWLYPSKRAHKNQNQAFLNQIQTGGLAFSQVSSQSWHLA